MLEQAHGGTLFLDEVADIPLHTQVKLLRALEYGEIWPVGADRAVAVDLRIITATHQDLEQRMLAGTFRHDLLYRLSSFQIRLPPLRERVEDIEDLCRHFMAMLASRDHVPPHILSAEALAELKRRPWHGNVRELRHALEHAMLMAGRGVIQPQHLPAPMPAPPETQDAKQPDLAALVKQWTQLQLEAGASAGRLYEGLLETIEPSLLKTVLDHCRGQVTAAARLLGLHRMTLRKKLDQHGIPREQEP
jgi:two-component system nitrogen regulation response regulator GlnG